jgi:hypothetical protein
MKVTLTTNHNTRREGDEGGREGNEEGGMINRGREGREKVIGGDRDWWREGVGGGVVINTT